MRVIAGSAKGRKLFTATGELTRPTPAKVREALFSMLARRLDFQRWTALPGVLDLFAGSGALGIEALSRGAPHATFVECAATALRALRRNLHGFATRSRLLAMPAAAALPHLQGQQFQLIFIDPPFASSWGQRSLAWVQQQQLLAAQGIIVREYASHMPSPPLPAGLHCVQQRHFGSVGIALLEAVRPA